MENNIVNIVKNAFDLEKNGQFKNAIEVLYQGLNLEPDNVEILTQIASLYLKLKNYEIAEEYAQKALERNSDSSFAKETLICIYSETKNKDKFISFVDKFSLNDNSKELLKTIFNAFIQFKLYKLAINFYNKLGKKENLDDENLYQIGLCYYSLKDFDNANIFAQKAYTINPDNINNKILLADIAYKNKDYKLTKQIIEKIPQEKFTSHIFYLLGEIAFYNSEYQKATDYYTKALENDNKNTEILYALSNTYYFLGWLDEALKTITKAKNISPEDVNILYLNAEIYFLKDKLDFSLQLISSILNINPNFINAKLLKANIYLKKDLPELACTETQNILKEESTNIFALKLHYEINKKLGFSQQILTILQKILLIEPENIEYMCKLAEAFCKLAQWNDAQIVIENIFNISKNYELAYKLAIETFFNTNNTEKAYDYAKNWLNINPNADYAHYILSQIAMPVNKETALKEIRNAIILSPQNPEYYLLAGDIYNIAKDFENAQNYYNEAFSINPQKATAIKLLNTAILLNDNTSIEKTFNKIKKVAPFDLELNFIFVEYLKANDNTQKAIDLLKHLEKGVKDKNLKEVIKSKIIEIK